MTAPPPSPTKSPNATGAASPSAGPGVRVLFLDVDGVVCCNDRGILEKDKMQLLKRIRDETGCKVCLSTNWRLYDDLRHEIYAALTALGIECVGSTPDAQEGVHNIPMRPLEIHSWVERWNELAAEKGRQPITSFVAVDDRPLLQEEGGAYLEGHFVQTYYALGLTIRGAARIVSLLKGENDRGRDSPDSVVDALDALGGGGSAELPQKQGEQQSPALSPGFLAGQVARPSPNGGRSSSTPVHRSPPATQQAARFTPLRRAPAFAPAHQEAPQSARLLRQSTVVQRQEQPSSRQAFGTKYGQMSYRAPMKPSASGNNSSAAVITRGVTRGVLSAAGVPIDRQGSGALAWQRPPTSAAAAAAAQRAVTPQPHPQSRDITPPLARPTLSQLPRSAPEKGRYAARLPPLGAQRR